MGSRPRRVPPPPPPGFGDDEYYALYGNPEEYVKYRYVTNVDHFPTYFRDVDPHSFESKDPGV